MIKNKNLRLKISLFIAVIGIASLIVGASYALFNTVLMSDKNQVIKAGAVAVKITETGSGIGQLVLNELTDEEGQNSDNYYSFTVQNIGTEKVYYEILLVDEEGKTSTLDDKYVRANVEIDGDLKSPVNIEETQRLIYQDTIEQNETKECKLRIWLNFGDLTVEQKQAELNKEAHFKLKIEVKQFTNQEGGGGSEINIQKDSSNANAPELASNMIPVIYDAGNNTWIKADITNKDLTWFNYTDKKWANAVTVTSTNRDTYLKATPGTPISMNDINTMWVWIPRFSATGDTANYNGGTKSAPGAFNITFVDKNTSAHDAFTFGSDQISGFWMGKFETTGSVASECTDENCNVSNVTILPNSASLVGQSVSGFFYMSRSMETSGNAYGFDKTKNTTLDTHMLKNNEWGAVVYLTQSIYGRCTSSTSCVEVTINAGSTTLPVNSRNNANYKLDLLELDFGDEIYIVTGANDYVTNINQSTTGNIYGVYDMSGGAEEYVMGVYWDGTKLWSGYNLVAKRPGEGNSGFNGCLGGSCSSTNEDGVAYPSDNKYYNLYTTSTNYTSVGLQHGMTETILWYDDEGEFVDGNNPWVYRGSLYDNSLNAGVFSFGYLSGNRRSTGGSRFLVVIN